MMACLRFLLCFCVILFGTVSCHEDDDVATLKAEIKQRWNIEVVDHNLQDTLRALLEKNESEAQLQDVASENEEECLKVVIQALSVYPPHFIKSLISKVATTEKITVWSIEVGGFNFDNTIALNCGGIHGEDILTTMSKQKWKAGNIHGFIGLALLHQHQWLFKNQDWQSYNPSDFHYGDMEDYKNSLRDHSPESRDGNTYLLNSGFVSISGTTNIEQDIGSYAMKIFGEPREFAQIIRKYPRMRGKTRIVMNMYLLVAPELKSFFDKTGLTDAAKN